MHDTAVGLETSSVALAGRRTWAHYLEEWWLYGALLIAVVFFSLASPYFLQSRNLLNIGNAVAVGGIVAAGMTMAMIAGYVDLTVGAVMGLTSVIIAVTVEKLHGPLWLGILLGLVAAVLVAIINGILMVNLALPAIIATLAMGQAVTGVSQLIGEGRVIPVVTDTSLTTLVNLRPLGIPVLLVVMLLVFVGAWIFMSKTRTGWHVYAIGGNSSAALRSGINVNRVGRGLLLSSALLAGLCGIITVGRAGAGSGTYGTGFELDVFTAVLLGGAGLYGGSGRVERTFVGVVFVGVLGNGLALIGTEPYVQQLVKGVAFVVAVVLSALAARRSFR